MTTTKRTLSDATGQSPIRIQFEGSKQNRTLTGLEDVVVDMFFRDGYLSINELRPGGGEKSLISLHCKIKWRSDTIEARLDAIARYMQANTNATQKLVEAIEELTESLK